MYNLSKFQKAYYHCNNNNKNNERVLAKPSLVFSLDIIAIIICMFSVFIGHSRFYVHAAWHCALYAVEIKIPSLELQRRMKLQHFSNNDNIHF